jgi:hypothetical protein
MGDDDGGIVIRNDEMAGLAGIAREAVHQRQGAVDQAPQGRMAMRQREEFHGQRVAVALARAADMASRASSSITRSCGG